MNTVPIVGTARSVSFFPDDSVETVRQLIALAVNSHPDRLFLEVYASLPKDYYATNPLHWSNLFLRLSFDGKKILQETLRGYLESIRPGTGITAREITRDEWEDHPEDLQPLFDPDTDFQEFRVLGTDEVHSFALPLPPKDLPGLQAASRPIPQTQSLFETMHPYPMTGFRVTQLAGDASPLVKLNYFPRLRPDTPPNIESMRATLEGAQSQLGQLLSLDVPKHETESIVRIKWYIPLVSSRITAPRTRFEQIFYGLTVSPETPYIGYFTSKTETMRHKFYCADPKQKKPLIDIPNWKNWYVNTQPQRRIPTLLLYRGTSRTNFDRIAVTNKDITVTLRRDKDGKESIEEMKTKLFEWMKTLDALIPFLVATDYDISRWELSDLSVVATYPKDIKEFDMLRFPCLQSIFGFQNDTFRLLRAEHASDDITPRQIQALQALGQEDAEATPEYLAQQLQIPVPEATELLAEIQDVGADINLEKSFKAYPTLKFTSKEVILKFVTNLERTLKYADILRHVLTSDSESVDTVCPRRMERVAAKIAVPQQELQIEGEFAFDPEFDLLAGIEPGPEPEVEGEPEPAAPAPKSKKVKIASKTMGTHSYFNNRLQSFDPETFDRATYPSKCDKPKQVVVLTAADKARIGSTYDYSTAAESERLEMKGPDGTAICPPYWCIRDELPLREEQLVSKEDGQLHCPVCDGKVRKSDSVDPTEFTVIKRDTAAKFPNYLGEVSSINKRRMPCCYKTERPKVEVLVQKDEDATYVLDENTTNIPGLRFAYIREDLAQRLQLKTNYSKSVRNRLVSGESDIFRVGLGRPSKTLPVLLNDKTPILRPKDAKENVARCSFFRTWKDRKEGDTEIDRIISSIDYAYQRGELGVMEEVEYVTSFLKCEVIRVDTQTGQVLCGFWSESVGASSRTICLLDQFVLCKVSRVKPKKAYVTEYMADLRKDPFKDTIVLLSERHARACAVNTPVLADAIKELQAQGKTTYQVILDPLNRIQAVFLPTEVLLPVQPANIKPDIGVTVRSGYADIRTEELPTAKTLKAFLTETRNAKFKFQADILDVNGKLVEIELKSGFRAPVQPEDIETPQTAREVTETIRRLDETTLVDSPPNAEDIRLAQEISYSSEIFEFLLFSLSKSIAADEDGEAINSDYADLRASILNKSATLYKDLDKWFKTEAYEDTTKSPVEFVNKVRTPCGQYADKEKCNKSSLCGWHKNTCKIRVKPIVEKAAVLKRIVKVLRENDKQRALVLDGRLSPFFSTILYLEMPHELITTSI